MWFAALLSVSFVSPVPSEPAVSDGPRRVAIKIQEPQGYKDNPSSLKTPLRQDVGELTLSPRPDGKFDVVFGDGSVRVDAVDLDLWIPRVPKLAKANPVLTRLALIQREFNRNEVRLGPVAGLDDVRLANNCLKTGLWEAMFLVKEGDKQLLSFHGWFDPSRELYSQRFEAVNGMPFAPVAKDLENYPALDGFVVPLDALRKVVSKREVKLTNHLDETVVQLSEQKRKAKLLLNPGVKSYADFSKDAEQPIRTAVFAEPGYYDNSKPMTFDLRWLANTKGAELRRVSAGGTEFDELEIVYSNGNRILIGDEKLASLPARTTPPTGEADVLKLTFGIGTPDIYASRAEREQELAADRASYLLFLGPGDKNVDNHLGGVDRAYLWKEAGTPERLHVWLVGYERIALVSHLSIPL
ncbi:MAG: hypothetical protein IT453_11635 [Planctomycetes bacterium]|nr:hypothetical protein [Planctomycetota bacterium]